MLWKRIYPALSLTLLITGLWAADWPQWRGPHRDGLLVDFSAPSSWPEKLTRDWKVEVGEGHSSPLIVGDRVFIHARQGEDEVVTALELISGSRLWESRVPTPYTMHEAALDHGKGPKSTPLARQGKLYTFGISGTLSCLDMRDGNVLWRRDFARDFKQTSPLFGVAMSPVIDGDLLIAHVGGHDDGALTAFEANSGKTVWSWKGDGPAYTSPIILELQGIRQIITQSQDNIVAVGLADGKLLWKKPFKTNYYQNSVTPVAFKDLVIFSGLDNGTQAIRAVKSADGWTPETVWETNSVSMYMNTPVLVGDLLYGLSHKRKGQYFCLDPASGEVIWTSPGREGENAAILGSPEVLFLLNTDAELVVAKTGREGYQPLAKYTVADSPTWAHPAISGSQILVKDLKHLTSWRIQ